MLFLFAMIACLPDHVTVADLDRAPFDSGADWTPPDDTADTADTADTGAVADTADTADTGLVEETGDTVDTVDTSDTVDTGETGETGDTATDLCAVNTIALVQGASASDWYPAGTVRVGDPLYLDVCGNHLDRVECDDVLVTVDSYDLTDGQLGLSFGSTGGVYCTLTADSTRPPEGDWTRTAAIFVIVTE